MDKLKRCLAMVMVAALLMGISVISKPGKVQAASKPGTPEVTVSTTKKTGQVKIEIGKTSGAEGFAIYMKAPGEKKFTKIKTIKKPGLQRTVSQKKILPMENMFSKSEHTSKKVIKMFGENIAPIRRYR